MSRQSPKFFHRIIIRMTNTYWELFAWFFGVVFFSAMVFMVSEQRTFWDSLWWALVTCTTTGYGDISPITLVGRLDAIFLMLFSILFILPLLIGKIASDFNENRDQFSHEEQEEIKQLLREIRATQGDKLSS